MILPFSMVNDRLHTEVFSLLAVKRLEGDGLTDVGNLVVVDFTSVLFCGLKTFSPFL